MGINASPRVKAILEALLVTFLWSSFLCIDKVRVNGHPAPHSRGAALHDSLNCIGTNSHQQKRTHQDIGGLMVEVGCTGLPRIYCGSGAPMCGRARGEYPNRAQIAGMILVLIGAVLFFGDRLGGYTLTGMVITFVSGLGWTGYMVAGKILFKEKRLSPLANTAFAMGFGTSIIFASAYLFEGLNPITLTGWAITIWLGIVNTAAAFFMWNHALETLDAFELSILQNTMLIQITILSVIFLGERLPAVKYLYMALVFIGVYIVQTRGGDSN